MRDARAEITRGVERVAGQTAKRHANGDDDTKNQKLSNSRIKTGHLIEPTDGEYQHERGDGLL